MASEHGREEAELWPPYDPRDFTRAEWDIIREALTEAAKSLCWRASRPTRSARSAAEMNEAAERRFDIGHRVVGARRWRVEADREREAG